MNEIFVVGPRVASDDMAKILKTVNDSYLKLKISDFYDTVAPDDTHDNLGPGTSGQRIFYRSDHYNFVKMGIPIAFFSDGLHTDYHRVTDSAEKIDYDKLEAVTKTVYAVSWVLGNSATRPKLNAKLPDQLVNDMKAAKDAGLGHAHAGQVGLRVWRLGRALRPGRRPVPRPAGTNGSSLRIAHRDDPQAAVVAAATTGTRRPPGSRAAAGRA